MNFCVCVFFFSGKKDHGLYQIFKGTVVSQGTELLELVDQLECSWLQTKGNPPQTGHVSVFIDGFIRIPASFLCYALGSALLHVLAGSSSFSYWYQNACNSSKYNAVHLWGVSLSPPSYTTCELHSD